MNLKGKFARRTGVRRRYYRYATLLLALIFGATLLTSVAVWAADSDLDPTFSGDGIATTSINNFDLGNDLAIQSNGKIVVVGSTSSDNPFMNDFAITRYNADGSLDATFGSGGIVTTSFGGNSVPNAVALQLDGKIVVAGSTDVDTTSEIRVARYNADGSLDTSFGSGGSVSTLILDLAEASDIVVQSDGKIVVTGHSITTRPAFAFLIAARYNSDGSLDNSFDGDGEFVLTQAFGFGNALALQSDGKIVIAGSAANSDNNSDFLTVRLNTDGSLDTSYGTGGLVYTNINGQQDSIEDVAIQADGKIVAAGTTGSFFNKVSAIARYNSDGSLDTSFDGDGLVSPTFTGTESESIAGVALQTDGKIVVAGSNDSGTGPSFEIKRYNGNGSADASFGSSGTVLTQVGAASLAAAVAIQADGKIVAAGAGNASFDPDTGQPHVEFVVVRYGAAPAANNPPVVTITGPASGSIYAVGTPVSFTGTFTDDAGDTHTAAWHFESITQSATVVEPSGSTPGTANTTHTFTVPGVYNVSLTVTDNGNLSGTATTVNNLPAFIVVYDPNGGWVTGGGWINSPAGAFALLPTVTGKATFGFVSKYQNGATVPTGSTEFQFKSAALNFKSTSYEWLVISGGKKAQYKGLGTINGGGSYRFMLTCIDGQQAGGGGVDKFRIRIWSDSNGLVYDNQLNAPDSDDPTTALGGGSIVIHH